MTDCKQVIWPEFSPKLSAKKEKAPEVFNNFKGLDVLLYGGKIGI